MKPHESPRINKKSIRGDSGDSWPVWNRGINGHEEIGATPLEMQICPLQQPYILYWIGDIFVQVAAHLLQNFDTLDTFSYFNFSDIVNCHNISNENPNPCINK